MRKVRRGSGGPPANFVTVRLLREELYLLQEPVSYVGEVVKPMGKKKVMVKLSSEGKFIVSLEKGVDISQCTPNTRVALRNDSYALHRILPTKVDPLVSLMKVCVAYRRETDREQSRAHEREREKENRTGQA
jgi:ATP-dependent 26S proteasome regulatory subunit